MAIKRYWEPVEYSEYITVVAERDELLAWKAGIVRRAREIRRILQTNILEAERQSIALTCDLAAEKVE